MANKLLGIFDKFNKSRHQSQTPIKYVYLDVVQFTLNRSVEDQIYIIDTLNHIIRDSTSSQISHSDKTIFIPIGDGICIAFLGPNIPYDIHMTVALHILETLALHNLGMALNRQFQVRVGLNQNDDNIITDINKRDNVAGAGVNFAQRIMNFADGNQITVGKTVHESLNCREKYMNKFHDFHSIIKHDQPIQLYQYVDEQLPFLNNDIPSQFRPMPKEAPRLSKFAAYYFAHSIKNRNFIYATIKDHSWKLYSFTCILYYLAVDSVGVLKSTKFNPYDKIMPCAPNGTIKEQFEEFDKLPFQLVLDISKMATHVSGIDQFTEYFEYLSAHTAVNENGQKKLREEWPDVWAEFGLDHS